MGTQVILNIHQVDPGTEIDIPNANASLMSLGMGELYEEFTSDPDFHGPFKMNGDTLTVANRWDSDFDGYGQMTMIWSCFHTNEMEEFARHIKSGKVVFHIDTEGWSPEYYVLTPNSVTKAKMQF
jgi:hypothetical protein